MKKSNTSFRLIYFVMLLLPISGLLAQECTTNAIAHLDANNVDALFRQGGSFWNDDTQSGYVVPKDNPERVRALYSGSLWLGGLDPAGNLLFSGRTYAPLTGSNAGPLINGAVGPNICKDFDRFWTVTRGEVQAHLDDYNDNHLIDNPIPSVMAWPGKENPQSIAANGFELPQGMNLAPFMDVDADGTYDPSKGDYPLIKGDKSIWWSYHYGNPQFPELVKANFFVMAYSAGCQDEVINNTTYYDVRFTYEGSEQLEDFYAGLWIDPDIGCSYDDYVGCSPEDNIAFMYNMDAVDGDNGCSCEMGISTYCNEIPVVSVKLLHGLLDDNEQDLGMTNFIAYNGINAAPATYDPTNTGEHYNLLKGLWKDGTPITTGGIGYESGGDVAKYLFPGNPSNSNEWSMCSEGLPPNDSRIVMSSGPVTMYPSAVNNISFAVVWFGNQSYPCPDMQPIIEATNTVVQPCSAPLPVQETDFSKNTVTASPNPVGDRVTITVTGTTLLSKVELLGMDGQLHQQVDGIHARQVDIERKDLAAGLYCYKATLADGSIATGKLVMK